MRTSSLRPGDRPSEQRDRRQIRKRNWKGRQAHLLELALVLVRLDQVASVIVNLNHSAM